MHNESGAYGSSQPSPIISATVIAIANKLQQQFIKIIIIIIGALLGTCALRLYMHTIWSTSGFSAVHAWTLAIIFVLLSVGQAVGTTSSV